MKNVRFYIGGILNYLFNNIITHLPLHGLRKLYLKLIGCKMGKNVAILMHTRILNPWKLNIADNVVINSYCLLDCRQYSIDIEANADIGPYTHIWTLGHDPNHNNHAVKGANVKIAEHTWIASRVTILPGVNIGKGAVVATCSVVTKNIEPLTIVAGNPAKPIGNRNNQLTYTLNYKPFLE